MPTCLLSRKKDPRADGSRRCLVDLSVAVVGVGELARDVGHDVSVVRSQQLEGVSTVAVVSLHLFRVGHGATVLDPREDEGGGDLLDAREELVVPGARDDDVETLAAV